MSLWTKLRDTIIRPVLGGVANTIAPGTGAIFTAGLNSPTVWSPPQAQINPPFGRTAGFGTFRGNTYTDESGQVYEEPDYGPMAKVSLPGAGKIGGLIKRGTALARKATGKRMGMKKRRRQNPINVKALRRAIRRVKAFKKIEAKVNKLLPKVKSHRTERSYGHPHSAHHKG
jgi:hypothetical protein